MKYVFYIFCLFAGFLISCSGNNKTEVKADDNDQPADTVTEAKAQNSFSNETVAFINETGFSKYAKSRLPQLDWDRFTLTRFWKEDFRPSAFTPSNNYFELYGKFLKYSPDSSMFIDLDSYNIDIHKDKRGRLVANGQGPDTEVSLVTQNKNERVRLVFLGPGNSVEDGAWIDNNNFILVGLQEKENARGTNAVIWKYDLSSKMVYLYELEDDGLVESLKSYSYKERLKDVIIQ